MINKLPENLREFSNFVENPFCIFEKKNFLSPDIYKLLRDNFPDEENFPGYHQQGKKIFFNNKHKEFEDFIKNNIWGDFYKYLNNKEFISFLMKLISPQLKLIENRKNIKNERNTDTIKKITTELFKSI